MSNAPQPQPWVDGLTIGQAFARTAQQHPDQLAAAFTALDDRKTWSELEEIVAQAAKGLLALGISKGDHVAVWATNVPHWVSLQLATARIGAVLVTVNPAYRPFELQYVLKQSDAAALFLVDRFKSSDYFEMLDEILPELADAGDGPVESEQFPKLRRVVTMQGDSPPGALSWEEMTRLGEAVEDSALRQAEQPLDPDDAINIQYTSGTTGFPKAATLTHRNLLLNAYHIGDCQRIAAEDAICIPVPFYHCFGCVLGTLCCVVHGSAMVVPAEYFQAEATLRSMEREKATSIYGVPTMFIAMLESSDRPSRDLSSLRTGIMAGSPCPIEVMRRVISDLGAEEVTIAYGQTEASPVITQTRTDDPIELRVETVGRPLPNVEVKVIDPESGAVLGDGEQGELCARGHVVMLGYYNNPEATAAAIDADGWLHTGDLAVRRADGYYRITGRIKDMVIRGGENVYPREIEEFLFQHPAIEQAAVVGVPDPKYGEELCAWIRLKQDATLTEDEIRDRCREGLARFKTPRYVKFVDAFPQTVTGKIQKFKIRELMMEELGLQEEETA